MVRQAKKAPRKKAKRATAFIPTVEDRINVAALLGAGCSTELARKMVRNPKTGRAVARSTFWIAFKDEIADGADAMNGKAAVTLARAMDDLDKDGNVSRGGVTAAIFWLKTRNSELFSERHINENIDKGGTGDALAAISDDRSKRLAQNVLDQLAGKQAAQAKLERLKRGNK